MCLNAGVSTPIPDVLANLELLKKEMRTERLAECESVIGGILATASRGEEAELSGCMAPERTDPSSAEKLHISRQTSPDSVLRSISPTAVAVYKPTPNAASSSSIRLG